MFSDGGKNHVTRCHVTTAYALKCAASGLSVGPWMEKFNCSWNCPFGMEFRDCLTSCPATCDLPDGDTLPYCHGDCTPGCQVSHCRKLPKTCIKVIYGLNDNFLLIYFLKVSARPVATPRITCRRRHNVVCDVRHLSLQASRQILRTGLEYRGILQHLRLRGGRHVVLLDQSVPSCVSCDSCHARGDL